ncbi:hypothetical protein [Sharpea porci]|uniref:hypothetical protein n=1 Tax=Sharpea porci TaxID=2652286 RepID=UPI002A920C8D|nr:hypothetical protein [Sharpea porci]MDY5279432.1 hypothetical protein [Sharpea porci]
MEMNKRNVVKEINQDEYRNDEEINTLKNKAGYKLNASAKMNTNGNIDLTKVSNSRNILKVGGTLMGLAFGRCLCGGFFAGVGMVIGVPVGAGLCYEAGVWFGTIAGAACGEKGATKLLDYFNYDSESIVKGESQFNVKAEASMHR